MNITIKDKEYKVRYTLRGLLIFENITGKSLEIKTLTDQCTLIYSMLHACNPECEVTFDDVIDAIDSDPNILSEVCNMIVKSSKHNKEEDASTKKV